jgi:predicted glutamine amidotransferase
MLGIYGKVNNWKEITLAFSRQAEIGKVPPKKGTLTGHKDGWGMAASGSKNKTMVLLERQSGSATDAPRFKQTLDAIEKQPAIFTCHLRKASPGIPVTPSNIHPFSADGWTFIHNGTIYQSESLLRDPSLPLSSNGSDSEHFFHYLLSRLKEKHGHRERGRVLAEAISAMEIDYTAVNSILSNGSEIFVIRKYKIHRAYYTLYTYQLPNGILISSEPVKLNGLDLHRWKMIENNSILKIYGDPVRIEKYRIE